MKVSISRRGVELETTPRTRTYTNWQWAKPSLIFAWPGELYRIAARRKIAALIDENRRLRRAGYGRQERQKPDLVRVLEWAFLKYLDRRWPTPPEEK
jgi:hypothetical protein